MTQQPVARAGRPRLAFVGLGWIGFSRMKSVVEAGVGDVVALLEPDPASFDRAMSLAPHAERIASIAELRGGGLDGLVIATPSALHAEQAVAGFGCGLSVFCQKPLARSRAETASVVAAARAADRRLAVDFCYRHTDGMRLVRDLLHSGELGEVYACDLVFHNAYGPDKAWFRDKRLSGGGCLMDLGIHLVDLAFWTTGETQALDLKSHLFTQGKRLDDPREIEDFASLSFDLPSGAHVSVQCSWNLNAGCDAEISATFHGTRGAARFRNVDGSFYHFVTERMTGTRSSLLSEGGEDWGSRAIVSWCRDLPSAPEFDEEAAGYETVADVIDRAYADAMATWGRRAGGTFAMGRG